MSTDHSAAVRKIVYPDYDPKEDFPLWLQGWWEKVRMACGLAPDKIAEVNAEIVKFIPAKFKSGTALNTYNALPTATKNDYQRLVKALTDEFLDPQERDRFNEDLSYNVRAKGQSIKEFMQDIQRDQNRYSDIPEFVLATGGGQAKNPTRVRDGIKRFRKGLRDRNGNKDRSQQDHMRYNLHQDSDLTWENALMVARRWEAAHDHNDSGSGSDEDVDAVECSGGRSKSRRSGRHSEKPTIISTVATEAAAPATAPAKLTISALAEEVRANAREIKGVKSEQEKLAANVNSWITSSKSRDEDRDTKLDLLVEDMNSRKQFNQQRRLQQNSGNYQRPSNYTWKGFANQNRQTGFGFNRSTPTQFPRQPQGNSTATVTAAAAAPQPTAAVAAMEQVDPAAQTLEDSEEGPGIHMSYARFLDSVSLSLAFQEECGGHESGEWSQFRKLQFQQCWNHLGPLPAEITGASGGSPVQARCTCQSGEPG